MNLYLAPLHGFTDATFRNAYYRYFEGIDLAVAPFISLTHGEKITRVKVKDLAANVNQLKPVIPQILGNESQHFILLCKYLHEQLGFQEVNWNLGCPINSIVRKKRGSGILPHPGMIDKLLNEIVPAIPLKLSVKLRLGFYNTNEFPPVANVLNSYPLSSVTIHPRLGIQQYEGSVMLDALEEVLPLIRHKVIYNGDIHQYRDFVAVNKRFPQFDDFMLGRGVFINPFLPEQIKTGSHALPADSMMRFKTFYRDLENVEKHSRRLWMSKMKEYWKYFGIFLKIPEATMVQVLRCESPDEWNRLISIILDLGEAPSQFNG